MLAFCEGVRRAARVAVTVMVSGLALPALAQQDPTAPVGHWQLDRVESRANEITGGNPCFAWAHEGAEQSATTTQTLICGDRPWSGILSASWSRPPDRLDPGQELEMTVRGSVTATHDGITASGQVRVDLDPVPCGRTGAGDGIAWIQVSTQSAQFGPSAEQAGTGLVPGVGPDDRDPRLQVRACMDGWQTYYIYRWVPEGSSTGPAEEEAGPPAADPETTSDIAILRYCRPLIAAVAPVLAELDQQIEQDRAALALWHRQLIEKGSATDEFVGAIVSVIGSADGVRPQHPGPLLAWVNQAIGRQEFLATLSWDCRRNVARIERDLAARRISEEAYISAHAGAIEEALRTHRAAELVAMDAACARAFDAMMSYRAIFSANPGELRWGTRANQEAGYQEECLRWRQWVSQAE